ncbi:MAG TPA: hypothetical protein VKE94_13625 [Gemmataceae bacterium]|nr:hypothetical protein [Gemmataceae bacterium]
MRPSKFLAVAAITLCSCAFLQAGEKSAGLTIAEFEKLHTELQPPKVELWRSIPWHVSILEAREAAAKSKKPIFVWVASGEPLGCG